MSEERPAEDSPLSVAKKRIFVAERAGGYCEYCRVAELNQVAPYNIEHVFPVSLGGTSNVTNLAWSCPRCNGSKSDHTELPDPDTGEMASVFNPRAMRWCDHFEWCEFTLAGRTPTGRAVVLAFQLNSAKRVRIRQMESREGLFPPPES